MLAFRSWALVVLLYISGLILYSSLFILSANQSAILQYGKIGAAALFSLVFIIPVFLVHSRYWVLRVLGYAVLAIYFLYVFFLIGYFSYFGFVPEVYAFSSESAGDMLKVSNHYFAQIFGFREIALILCAGAFFYLLPRHKPSVGSVVFLALPVVLFASNVIQFGTPIKSATYGNASVIRRFGLPTFYFISMQERINFTSDYLAEEVPFPGQLSQMIYPDKSNYAPQISETLDVVQKVVLVQIESFDLEAIDAEMNGVMVMPFVSDLRKTACRDFTEFHTIKSVGGSSDAEFSVATGRLPSTRRQAIRHADFTKIETIYDILEVDGVESYFAHNNNIGFYGRNLAYDQIDSVNSTFLRRNNPRSENSFAIETLTQALEASDRMFYYFFNFKSHGPFQGFSQAASDRFGFSNFQDIKSNYLATMYDVDQTIAAMFEKQKKFFDEGNSLFILTSDHPSALHTDDTALSQTRIPMMLCHSDFDGAQIENVGSTVNLFATILDAFGVLDPDVAVAQSLLSDAPRVVLFPSQTLLYRKQDGTASIGSCNERCRHFFDYTDQHIRISN